MVVLITLFFGTFWLLVQFYVVLLVLWFTLWLVGQPIRWFVDSITFVR